MIVVIIVVVLIIVVVIIVVVIMEIDLNRAVSYAVDEDKQSIVLKKAKELVRKIEMKIPTNKKNIIIYRNIIAVDFACRILEISYDSSKLISLAGISQKIYQDSFIYCKNLLDLKWNVPAAIELLAIHFDQKFKNPALKIYDEYYEKYVNKQLKPIQDGINNSLSAYYAAAFYIAAKDMNINLDKLKIIQLAEVDSSLFKNCVESMSNVCGKNNIQKISNNSDHIVSQTKNRHILQLQHNQNTNSSSSSSQSRQPYEKKTSVPNLNNFKALNKENLQILEPDNFEKIDEKHINPILSKLKFEKVDKSEVINKQIRALGIVPSAELEQKKREAEDEEEAKARESERTKERYEALKREVLAKRRKLESNKEGIA